MLPLHRTEENVHSFVPASPSPFTILCCLQRENAAGSKCIISMTDTSTSIRDPQSGDSRTFTFDKSYWSHDGYSVREQDGVLEPASQASVYADQVHVLAWHRFCLHLVHLSSDNLPVWLSSRLQDLSHLQIRFSCTEKSHPERANVSFRYDLGDCR